MHFTNIFFIEAPEVLKSCLEGIGHQFGVSLNCLVKFVIKGLLTSETFIAYRQGGL